ncbi:MAG: RNA polymerase sigma factor [Planctomycetota bacterium]
MATDDLVMRAVEGDSTALEELLLSECDHLVRFLAARLGSRFQGVVDAEDLLQETLLQVVRDVSACRAQSRDAFRRWLFALADHRVRDVTRGLSRNRRGGGKEPRRLVREGDGVRGEPASARPTPSWFAMRREAAEFVNASVKTLSEQNQSVIFMRYWQDKSLEEMAATLDRSPAAVHGIGQRSRRKLRLLVDQSWLRSFMSL